MKTIGQQLTRKLLLTVGLILGAGGATVYLCARATLQGQFDAALRAKAQAIATLTEEKSGRVEIEFSDEHMRGFEARGNDFFELWDGEGGSLERSRSLRDAHLPPRHGSLEEPVFWNLTLPEGRAGRAVGIRFRPQESEDAPAKVSSTEATLVVATVRRELDRTLTAIQLVLLGTGLLLAAVTAFVVPRVLRRELRPLRALAGDAARIDAGSLSARFGTEGLPGELAPITARLNELLARLEDSFERERRFSSDVAHEFRTPVAELRGMAELAIKLPDARAATADHETLEIALHLESILTRLLAMARAEQGGWAAHQARVALAPMLQDLHDRFRARAADRDLEFRVSAPEGAQAETDPMLLRSILINLLDNAIYYTPRGGTVDVEAEVNHGRLTLRVVNTVDNLDHQDLPRLFERFWRKDPARSADGHAGLGLSLARAFASALGCELTATLVGPARLALTLTQLKTNQV